MLDFLDDLGWHGAATGNVAKKLGDLGEGVGSAVSQKQDSTSIGIRGVAQVGGS